MKSILQHLAAIVLLVVLGCIQTHGANVTTTTNGQYKIMETLDKTNPVEAKIDPMTVWYWCGFKSMKKLSVSVQTTRAVSVYTQAKGDFKKDLKMKGWVVNPGALSKKSFDGWYLPYNRCLVVRNDGTGSDDYAVIEVRATESNDSNLILILCGIVAGGLLIFTVLLWCLIKLCHKCCGRSKKKSINYV